VHVLTVRHKSIILNTHLPQNNMNIYITKNGQNLGPYDTEEVNKQLRAGIISPSDLAWQEGMADWCPLSAFPGIQSQAYSQMPPRPPVSPAPPQTSNSTNSLGGNWNVAIMVGACVGTLIIPLIGIVMGIIGLVKHENKSQGGILLGLGILMMLVYLGLSDW